MTDLFVETFLIPATWREIGVGVHAEVSEGDADSTIRLP